LSKINKFSTGSLETLKVPNILSELKKFHDDNYSSNLMSLVIVGKSSLDKL
jgi:secreted Zn-dependent insulinase-like peptidase